MNCPTDGLTMTFQPHRLLPSASPQRANDNASGSASAGTAPVAQTDPVSSGSRSAFRSVSHGVSLVSVSVEAIVDAVVKQVFPNNTLPTNDELARQLGVSRTVLREALNQLVARGILEPRMNLGTLILDERQWQIVDQNVVRWRQARGTDPLLPHDLATIRRLVEPFAAADAAANAGDEARTRVLAACERRLASPARGPYLAARRELHLAVIAACSNQVVQQFGCFIDLPDVSATAATFDPNVTRHDLPHETSTAELGTVTALAVAFGAHQADAAYAAMTALLDWDLSPLEVTHA